jgi:hypothetical protein
VHFLLLGDVGSAVGVDGSSLIPSLLSAGDVACIPAIKVWLGEAIRVVSFLFAHKLSRTNVFPHRGASLFFENRQPLIAVKNPENDPLGVDLESTF